MLRFGFEQENVHEKLLQCWIERSLKRSQSILKAPQSVVDQVKGYFAALGKKFPRPSRDLVAVNSIEIFVFMFVAILEWQARLAMASHGQGGLLMRDRSFSTKNLSVSVSQRILAISCKLELARVCVF